MSFRRWLLLTTAWRVVTVPPEPPFVAPAPTGAMLPFMDIWPASNDWPRA